MASDTAVRADALLAELELTEAMKRQACVVLADVALRLSGDDPQAAKDSLAVALEALWVVPYEPGGHRTMWGFRPLRPGDEDGAA